MGQAVGVAAVLEPVDGEVPSRSEEWQGQQEWKEEPAGLEYGQWADEGEVKAAEAGLAAEAKATAEEESEAEAGAIAEE